MVENGYNIIIIITEEFIHKMKNAYGNKGFMAIKIDLEKTYDRLIGVLPLILLNVWI